MSRYDRLDSDQLKAGVTAMNELAQEWEIAGQTAAADAMHDQINQVLGELEDRDHLK